MTQRIKGQEVEVILVVDNEIQDTLTDVKSFSMTLKFDRLQEQYLGQKTDQYDEIFRGAAGNMELHFATQDVFDLFNSIVNRAKRRTPGTKINVKATMNFPNGDRPRVLIPDVSFGDIPIAFGDRGSYGTVSLDFAGPDYKTL